MTYARLAAGPDAAVHAALGGDAQGLAVETSGSTGEPREVLIGTHALRAAAAATHARLAGPGHWLLVTPPERIAGAMVLVRSHIAGTTPSRMAAAPFTAAAFAQVTATMPPGRPRYVSLVPTQLRRLVREPEGVTALNQFDAVLVGGAAVLDTEVPANVVTTYGLTETAGGCVYDGVPLDGVSIDIDRDDRIWISGDVLADGYAHEGDRGARSDDAWVTRDGARWLRTQDLGTIVNGRLEVWGRADAVIITGGANVHPAAVERAIATMDAVTDVAVLGVDDPEWGERVVAVVEPAPHASPPSLAELRDHCASTLERYQLPTVLHVMVALPRLASGKIDRNALRHLVAGSKPRENT
jgi:O-succinylbenzoic acid--CoA ligase